MKQYMVTEDQLRLIDYAMTLAEYFVDDEEG